MFRPDPDPNLSKYPDPTGSGSETLVFCITVTIFMKQDGSGLAEKMVEVIQARVSPS